MTQITIPSPRTVLTPTGFDIKLQNYYVEGGTMIIETIPQYLARVSLTVRPAGKIVIVLYPKGDYVIEPSYPISTFKDVLINFDLKYYHFKDGVLDENFVEIEFGSAVFNTYEGALKSGYIGTLEQWIYLSGATTYALAIERGFIGTEEDWNTFVSLYAKGPKGDDGAPGSDATVGFKEFTAFVSQTSTDVPTAIVLKNDIGSITFSRISVGIYRILSAGLFTADKTSPIDDIMQDQLGNLYTMTWIDSSTIELRTYAAADITVLADGVLNKRYINIALFLS
jgi:hypothetical protein